VDEMFTPQLPEGSPTLAAMKKLGPFLWGHSMSDPDPAVNHGLGSLITTGDNAKSGVPAGALRWAGVTGPAWAISRKLGVAWFLGTQLIPNSDPTLGSYVEAFSRLVFDQAAKRTTSSKDGIQHEYAGHL
jgi:hypothetical protein